MPTYLILLVVLLSNVRKCPGTVLRGARAHDGQFPWLIQYHTIAACGGVLISPDWVLTAAQCVEQKRNSIELYANGLNGTGSSQIVSVKATYIYPGFQAYAKPPDHDRNIALLKLVRAFDMCNGQVRLLDIAPVRFDDDYKSCLIFGWQSTVEPRSSKVLAKPVQYSKVLLNLWRACMYMHGGNSSYKNVFCTMIDDEHGMRACAGNPGSPVVCEDQYQRMFLLGIASWSNFSFDCGGLPTYLGVSVFRSWMWELIFGNKNMEQWRAGLENAAGSCQRERNLGGINAGNNFHLRKLRNDTQVSPVYDARKIQIPHAVADDDDDDEEAAEEESADEDAYAMSWKSSSDRLSNAPKSSTRVSGRLAKIPDLRGRLEPSNFGEFDDYTRILGEKGSSRKASDFDVVREREEQLSQYREIGSHNRLDEPIAVPSEQEKRTIVAGINGKRVADPEEIFDDLELVMPDGIEDFYRSNTMAIRIRLFDCFTMLLVTFCNIINAR